MAKNWTVAEAYEAIKAGDKSAIADFGKRFPLATLAVTNLSSGAELLISGLPEHVTMRKIDSALKDGVKAFEDDEEAVETPVKKSTGKRGRPSKSELKARESEAKEAEENSGENLYEGKSAVELFKLCKKRGITVQPKQKSSVYIDLLKAADKKLKKDEEDEEEDDWEDEEEEEKPAKKPVKSAKSDKVKKFVKKSEPDDDEDGEDGDDWDI